MIHKNRIIVDTDSTPSHNAVPHINAKKKKKKVWQSVFIYLFIFFTHFLEICLLGQKGDKELEEVKKNQRILS